MNKLFTVVPTCLLAIVGFLAIIAVTVLSMFAVVEKQYLPAAIGGLIILVSLWHGLQWFLKKTIL